MAITYIRGDRDVTAGVIPLYIGLYSDVFCV